MFCGRTGAEPELHAIAHLLERTRSRLAFECVHIHWRMKPLLAAAGQGARHVPAGLSSVVFGAGTAPSGTFWLHAIKQSARRAWPGLNPQICRVDGRVGYAR
jgi:hypothetical protein